MAKKNSCNMPITPGDRIYLERDRVNRLLKPALQYPLVIVSAGAGYGKTHAIYAFVRKYNLLTAWMQLSERDNIGDRFWENFITAVTAVNRKAAARLAEIDFPETERQFERYMTIPLEESAAGLKCVFVYDDFHLIQDKAVLRFMEHSITSPFPSITSILISRTEPPLNLMQAESKGHLARITEEDLRFTYEEMVSYYHLLDVSPSPQTAASVYHDTEGWAFAIHLAGLSLKHAPSGAVYINQALRSNIFKLIETEIMAPLPPSLQRFLVKLSCIEQLVPELLEELAGDLSLIQKMKEIESFIRFDVYQNAYHIHHLFLDYLKGKQGELSADEKRDVWIKTAAWCTANNQKIDAIGYYEKAGDYQRLVDVTYTLPLILPTRTARMLLEILERAPPEIYDHIAIAHILRTRLYITLEMFEKADKELITVIAKLEALPSSPAVNRTLTGCYNNRGFIGIVTSSFTQKHDYVYYFERARHFYTLNPFTIKPPVSVAPLGAYLCRVNSEDNEEMERYIEGVAGMAAHVPVTMGGSFLGIDDLVRGELLFFKGDIVRAERLHFQALHKARLADQYELENRALFYLLRINLTRGNHEAIVDIIKQLETQLDEAYYLNRYIDHDIITGWYYSHIGQIGKLAPWLKNDFEESDLNSIVYGLEILVKAKYYFSEKRYPAVLAVLQNREAQGSRWTHVLGSVEIKALEAVCRYQSRDKNGAFAVLEHAYRLALSNELFMPFVELGKHMRALVEAAIKDKIPSPPQDWLEKVRLGASAYAKKLFAVKEQYRPVTPRSKEIVQGGNLSRRELGVLTSLSQGMTREEIAGTASLSVNTVKSVIRSIYNKLGAVNKADAVRIGVSLGLIQQSEFESPE
jgi:LuxR family maltose regulon positive regulatory protein